MAQRVIDIDQPEAKQTRTELTLGRIGREWSYRAHGSAYVNALLDFLRSIATRDTLRSYSYSILQFFDWYQQKHGRIATPDEIRRVDAAEYDEWLRFHTERLTKWQLEHDPTRRLDLAIFEIVSKSPGIGIEAIRDGLGRYPQLTAYYGGKRYLKIEHPTEGSAGGLGRRLACLAKVKTINRTPSVEEYRRQMPGALDVPDEVFRYFAPENTSGQGAERASTVATRLSALASLWDFMIRSGENVRGLTEPLLRYNIWTEALKRAQAQAPSHREVTRARKTPDLSFFFRLLATTFYRTHGRERAVQAAEAAFWGRPGPAPYRNTEPSFKDLRDRAMLLLMGQTGVRSKEVHLLKRRDIVGDPPVVTVTGKRGKKRSLAVPPAVMAALTEMDAKIRLIAAHQVKYGRTDRAEGLLVPEAPLLPAIAYWGANSGQREQGLTRPGIGQMLRRRAVSAGMDPDGPDYDKAHPHGLRHMYIKLALESTPPHKVRAIVGHASLATTGRYAEERDPHALIAESLKAVAAPVAAVPAVRPPVRREPLAGAEPLWEPAREPISPPAAPPSPPRMPEPRLVARKRVEERVEVAPPAAAPPLPAAPAPAAVVPAAEAARRAVARVAPAPAGPAPAAPPPSSDNFVQQIERYRGKPITVDEERSLEKCRSVTDEVLRKLCIIYLIHWGEPNNRQQLVGTGGGSASVEAKRVLKEVTELLDAGRADVAREVAEAYISERRIQKLPRGKTEARLKALLERPLKGEVVLGEQFTANVEEEEEWEDEPVEEGWVEVEEDVPWEQLEARVRAGESEEEALEEGEWVVEDDEPEYEPEPAGLEAWAAEVAPVEQMERERRIEEAEVLIQMTGTNKLARIYSGKESGLSWWTGTQGRLKPEMPVLSPEQVGECSSSGQSVVCELLSDLWVSLAPSDPTRAQAIEQWAIQALDVAAQMEDVVLAREGTWVGSLAPWEDTKSRAKKKLKARTVFREHLAEEVIAWFKAVSHAYHLSPGDPEGWTKKTAIAKVSGEPLPDWYTSSDPIAELASAERYEMLDWIYTLTGGEPSDTTARYAVSKNVRPTSRRDIAKFVTALCNYDKAIDRMREDDSVGPFKATSLAKRVPIDEWPVKHGRAARAALQEVNSAIARATGNRVTEIDLKQLVAKRLSAKKAKIDTDEARQKKLSSWYLNLVQKYFGTEAARDGAIRLVALCGRVPLGRFREFFNISGGTIKHDSAYIKAFARRYGTHSECVARRIARELWEMKKVNPRGQYMTKPQHMATLIEVMKAFKVPCTKKQEEDVAYHLPPRETAEPLHRAWDRFKTREVREEERYEGPERLRAIAYEEVTPEQRARFTENVYGGGYMRNPGRARVAVPTPIHLIAAVLL